jgi:hypothetical protein
VTNANIEEKNKVYEKAVIPERELRSETPKDNFDNEINVAEKAPNDDHHDGPCENC